MRGVDQSSRAVLAESKTLLHGSVGRIAAIHAPQLENPLGIVSLPQSDPGGILVHLDAEVEAECAEVANVEDLLHLSLERLHFIFPGAGDDQIVDVDADKHRLYIAASWALCWKPNAFKVLSSFAFHARGACRRP